MNVDQDHLIIPFKESSQKLREVIAHNRVECQKASQVMIKVLLKELLRSRGKAQFLKLKILRQKIMLTQDATPVSVKTLLIATVDNNIEAEFKIKAKLSQLEETLQFQKVGPNLAIIARPKVLLPLNRVL